MSNLIQRHRLLHKTSYFLSENYVIAQMYGNKADMVLVYDQGPTQVRAALNHNKNFQSGSFRNRIVGKQKAARFEY
jgi:hypothetical protein